MPAAVPGTVEAMEAMDESFSLDHWADQPRCFSLVDAMPRYPATFYGVRDATSSGISGRWAALVPSCMIPMCVIADHAPKVF